MAATEQRRSSDRARSGLFGRQTSSSGLSKVKAEPSDFILSKPLKLEELSTPSQNTGSQPSSSCSNSKSDNMGGSASLNSTVKTPCSTADGLKKSLSQLDATTSLEDSGDGVLVNLSSPARVGTSQGDSSSGSNNKEYGRSEAATGDRSHQNICSTPGVNGATEKKRDLNSRCAECGMDQRPGSKFCGRCGRSARDSVEGQESVVAALTADKTQEEKEKGAANTHESEKIATLVGTLFNPSSTASPGVANGGGDSQKDSSTSAPARLSKKKSRLSFSFRGLRRKSEPAILDTENGLSGSQGDVTAEPSSRISATQTKWQQLRKKQAASEIWTRVARKELSTKSTVDALSMPPIGEVSDPTLELRYPLNRLWLDNDAATFCRGCKLKFTAKRRKRHCRVCGRLYCKRCLPAMLQLPLAFGYGFGPQKACLPCARAVEKREILSPVDIFKKREAKLQTLMREQFNRQVSTYSASLGAITDHYEVLGVGREASEAEIRMVFLDKMREVQRENAKLLEECKQVQRAYLALRDMRIRETLAVQMEEQRKAQRAQEAAMLRAVGTC